MPNVDQLELDKFARLAASWWDPRGECRPLHELNPCRTDFVADQAKLRGTDVLDVGCGGGILTESLARLGAHCVGIDANRELIEVARRHAVDSELEIDYRCRTAEDTAEQRADAFDVIVCMELLEHVPDPRNLVCACATLLRSGGTVVFSTINRTVRAYASAVIAAEYVLGLLPRGTHDYEKFIRPSELARWCRQADGPDQVHQMALGKQIIERYSG